MVFIIDRIDYKIRRSFSEAACEYDLLTSLHKEIARELVAKIKLDHPEGILDIGMGTGYLTNKLVHLFPEAKVIGLDFAPGMVEQAKQNNEGFAVVEADACQIPCKGETFDLVVSNLAYQWITDLTEAFGEVQRVLKRNGVFYSTIFGQETLKELFMCLENIPNGKQFNARRLVSAEQTRQILAENRFEQVNIKSEHIKVHFASVTDLLKWLKRIGANRLAEDIPIGKEWLSQLEAEYAKFFSDRFGIYATFEVIWVEGKK